MDSNQVGHSFRRLASGTIATFDVPGAGTGSREGTDVFGVNQSGQVTGYYIDSTGGLHGFLGTP